jgi:hypothetical protein
MIQRFLPLRHDRLEMSKLQRHEVPGTIDLRLRDVANFNTGTVGEYDATTGAAINATFITGLTDPIGIAVK